MTEKIARIFNQMIRPLKRSVLLMIGRGVLTALDSSKDIQLASVNLLADESKDKTEFFQHFGFTSRPPSGSDAIFLSLGGNRDHGVIIGSESRAHRLKDLDQGDCALYNVNGKHIWLKGDNIEMKLAKLVINNDSHELVAVLHEYFEAVRDGLTVTAIGPQPWDAGTIANLQAVIDKLETFKE